MHFTDLRRLIIFTCLMLLENVIAMNIIEVLKNNDGKTFVNLAEIAGLRQKMESETLTVFAPSDKAFQRLPVFLLEMLRQDNKTLYTMLNYHIVKGTITTDEMKNNRKFMALSGLPIRINTYKAKKLTLVEGTILELKDKRASNGVVHIMDRIMRPPHGTIMEVLQADPDNSIFVDLIKRTNLQNLLSNTNSNLTIFAPTNAAFSDPQSKLYIDNIKDTNILTGILSYHILPKTVYQLAMVNGTTRSSLLKTTDMLRFRNYDLGLHVENALITLSDSSATNGVVHQIDRILIPPSLLKESGITMNSIDKGKVKITQTLKLLLPSTELPKFSLQPLRNTNEQSSKQKDQRNDSYSKSIGKLPLTTNLPLSHSTITGTFFSKSIQRLTSTTNSSILLGTNGSHSLLNLSRGTTPYPQPVPIIKGGNSLLSLSRGTTPYPQRVPSIKGGNSLLKSIGELLSTTNLPHPRSTMVENSFSKSTTGEASSPVNPKSSPSTDGSNLFKSTQRPQTTRESSSKSNPVTPFSTRSISFIKSTHGPLSTREPLSTTNQPPLNNTKDIISFQN